MSREERDAHKRWRREARWRERHGRASSSSRFFRRALLIAIFVFTFAVSGVHSLASLLASRLGIHRAFVPTFIIVCLVLALIAAIRAFRAMRRFGGPLTTIMDAADRVADGDYGARVREVGPPPVQALARSFNTMTTKLQSADRLRRDLMADVAHELRTPLTVLQGRIEGLIDGLYKPSAEELERLHSQTQVLSRLIDDLRILALSDAGALALQREPTDLAHLLRSVAHSFAADAAQHAIDLQTQTPAESVVLELDAVRIQEVLNNLLANGLHHAGASRIDLRLESATDATCITLQDNGAGMSAEAVAHMFDRFYKRAESKGSGLGLAIAKQLIEAHGGRIEATSVLGQGTSMRIVLPRASA